MCETSDAIDWGQKDPQNFDATQINYAPITDTGNMIRELEKRKLHEQDIIELFKLIGIKLVHDL